MPQSSEPAEQSHQEDMARGAEEADCEERSVGGTGQTERQDWLDGGGRREERPHDPRPLVGQGLVWFGINYDPWPRANSRSCSLVAHVTLSLHGQASCLLTPTQNNI